MNRFARAALAGLFVGLILASLALMGRGALSMTETCDVAESDECAFQETMSHQVGRTQLLAGIGCLCMGAGLGLMLRQKPKNQ
jgi:hypothetical protein